MRFNVNEIDLGILVENMPDLIFYLDMDKKLLFFNEGGSRFLKMIGCHNPLPGDDVLAFFPEKKRNYLLQELDQLNKGEVFSYEDVFLDNQNAIYFDTSLYALSTVIQIGGADGPAGVWRHVLKNGQYIFMQIYLHRIRYNNDNAVMAIAQNVTDKLELERKLEDEINTHHQQLTEAIISAQEVVLDFQTSKAAPNYTTEQ